VTPPIPDQIPKTFTAGETVKFKRSFNDYSPADGWRYTIYFNGATDTFNSDVITDPENAGGFLVTLTPTVTGVGPGVYRFIGRVRSQDGSEVYTVDEGVVEIEFDLATAPAGATLSFAEQALGAIEAEILSRITADVEEYSVQASSLGGGRSMKKVPLDMLQKLRGYYAGMVWRKKNPGKIGAPVLVDFVDETNDQNFPATWVDATGLPGAGQ